MSGKRQSRHKLALKKRERGLVLESLEDRRLLTADLGASSFSKLGIDATTHRDSSFLVQFRPDASAASIAAAGIAGVNLGPEWSIAPGLREVSLQPGVDLAAALAAYQSNPNVLYAEPDYRVQLQSVPDDPMFSTQWEMDNQAQEGGVLDADIDAAEAWDKTTGSHNVVVAVIDTGVDYTHPDLAANMWVNPGEIAGDGIDNDHNGYVDDIHGYDFANKDGDPMDDHFHGTHVAGTIGAVGNNGIGVAGVSWSVQIMALKFLDASGGGFTSDAIAAVNYAVANGATVANASWGGGSSSKALKDALDHARDFGDEGKGMIFVAAAGNDGSNNDTTPFYPANYNDDNIVSVAATDHNDQLASFSNYGKTTVDIAAPGVNILSTFPTQQTQAMIDAGLPANYGSISGTSMATPHVTGVIALVRALHPLWSYNEIINQVLNTADVIPAAAKTVSGARLNAAGAVGEVPPDVSGPRIVSSDPTGFKTGAIDHVRLQFSERIDPATFKKEEDIVSFTGPGGTVAITDVTPVAGSNDRQFDVTFATQSAEGLYSLVIGPDISDLVGNRLDQDADGNLGEDPDDQYTASFTLGSSLVFPSTDPDLPAPYFGFFAVGISYFDVNEDVTIGDLNVRLNLTDQNAGDLLLQLVSPSGNSIFLSSGFNSGPTTGFIDTVFDDEATTLISDGSSPFTGSYQPDDQLTGDAPLSTFDGESTAGTWSLELWISGGNSGWLNSWALEVTPADSSGGQAPSAVHDYFTFSGLGSLTLLAADLLANDFGQNLSLTSVGDAYGGNVSLDAGGSVIFTPNETGYLGLANFDYTVSDGTHTSVASVTVDVRNPFPWHHAGTFEVTLDVDKDGAPTSTDALYIINALNAGLSDVVFSPEGAGPPAFYYDVDADNYVTPTDALMVINYLNALPAMTNVTAADAAGTTLATSSSSLSAGGQAAVAQTAATTIASGDSHQETTILSRRSSPQDHAMSAPLSSAIAPLIPSSTTAHDEPQRHHQAAVDRLLSADNLDELLGGWHLFRAAPRGSLSPQADVHL
jgi:subtilisin family serine protease/subtilisin-like proprotein convertase family protein